MWVAIAVAATAMMALGLFIRRGRGRRAGMVAFVTGALLVSMLSGSSPATAGRSAPDCPPTSTTAGRPDADGDGLPNANELLFGSDVNRADGDGDGLSDPEELRALTDPRKADTDADGQGDASDDTDGDGLSNLTEVRGVTAPADEDSDDDGLDDGAEHTRRTNPTRPDTDGDAVNDGDEVTLGSDPLKAVKNQRYTRTVTSGPLKATASLTGTAGAVVTARLASALPELGKTPGRVGTPVSVLSDAPLLSGTLTLSVDPALVKAGNFAVLHFEENTGTFDQPKTQTIDRATGRFSVTTNKFSPFVLVNIDQFKKVWESELDLPRDGANKSVAAMLAIDSSGSMVDNDPAGQRKDAAKQFVDALVPGDLAGGVTFNNAISGTQPLTSNLPAVKSFIDKAKSEGGTNIGVAVDASLKELERGAGSSRARIMVLLTDGDGAYDAALTAQAADSKTKIYTVGLGEGVQDTLLQGIADGTGGKYFKIGDAAQLLDTYKEIAGDLGSPDTDGDGISDKAETAGWRTQKAISYRTDPKKADTDQDGLSDGLEAGPLTKSTWGEAYEGVSDPTLADSDADSLDDASEFLNDTDPFDRDTDRDGLTDDVENEFDSDPTSVNIDGDDFTDSEEFAKQLHPMEYDLTGFQASAAMVGGFVFGDWEGGARRIGRLNDQQRQSFQYIAGQIASGIVLIGDVRDFLTNAGGGNFGGAALSAAGLIPVVGDGAKISKSLFTFAKRGAAAEKVAYRYAYELPVSQSLKRSIAAKAVGPAAKVFPKALVGGPARTFVYIGVDSSGKSVYAGISVNVAKRQAQHGARFTIDPIPGGPFTRGEARAIEQALINRAGGPKSPGFLNKINSISPKKYYFDDAVEWGEAWLKTRNIPYP
jgi:hypothetical protein